MRRNTWLLAGTIFLWAILGSLAIPAAAQVSVTSANPNNAPQGSTNLIVKIGGSGFKRNSKSAFYVSGTTDPGGITVNSTTFVSKSEVDANITVSSTATLSGFDIYVTSGGRTGKGTDLFSVTSNPSANQSCVTQGTAAGWTLVDVLNHTDSSGNPQYTAGNIGTAVRVQLVSAPDANGNVVPQFYVGLAGSGHGAQTIAFILNLDGTVRRSWLVLSNFNAHDLAVGDVNGDGAPDFVIGSLKQNAVHLFIGHLTGSVAGGNLDYNIDPATDVISLPAPAGAPSGFGYRVAMGDLNGDGIDEIAVSDMPAKVTRHAPYGLVYIYVSANSAGTAWNMVKTIPDPGAYSGDAFGTGLSIGDLTTLDGAASGTRLPDVAVAATDAGLAYVFQDPLGSVPGSGALSTLVFSIGSADLIGSQAGNADLTGDGFPDLIAVVGSHKILGSNAQPGAQVFSGPLYQTEQPGYTLVPDYSLDASYGQGFDAADIDGDGVPDVVAGAPNATYGSSCTSAEGVVYVYRTGGAAFPGYTDLFEMPVINDGGDFGHSVAAAPYTGTYGPIILVGANLANVGTQSSAGQIYIYRKTQ